MRIAVTGGIAEGKSTVVAYAASLGVSTASADSIAASIFSQAEVQGEIAERLGLIVPIDRSELRKLIAVNPDSRRTLNQIMHPRIKRAIDDSAATMIEVPLLIEGCRWLRFDRIWVVTCGSSQQLARLIVRLGDQNAAKALLSSQLSSVIKCAFADAIVRTDRPESHVFDEVQQLLCACRLVELRG